jgi:hypothetical protein
VASALQREQALMDEAEAVDASPRPSTLPRVVANFIRAATSRS